MVKFLSYQKFREKIAEISPRCYVTESIESKLNSAQNHGTSNGIRKNVSSHLLFCGVGPVEVARFCQFLYFSKVDLGWKILILRYKERDIF